MALHALLQDRELPATADFHVHLRDGRMMEKVVPTIRHGGVNTVYVMPNLTPPITTVAQAMEYRQRLQALEPRVRFLMTLYLHPSMTPATIREAKAAGILGVKSYPQGVTTNSGDGVVDYTSFYPIFAEMERQDLVLNLHGECPSSERENITVLNAEEKFLPTLHDLHRRFPRLRIVLEHVTTAAAVEAIRSLPQRPGSSVVVAATITAHHLFLTQDDWTRNAFHYCKPVAKRAADRTALLHAVLSADPRFFFGSDSAPHPASAKRAAAAAGDAVMLAPPGVYTQPYATQLVFDALTLALEQGRLSSSPSFETFENAIRGFLSDYGRAFYRIPWQEGFDDERILVRIRPPLTTTTTAAGAGAGAGQEVTTTTTTTTHPHVSGQEEEEDKDKDENKKAKKENDDSSKIVHDPSHHNEHDDGRADDDDDDDNPRPFSWPVGKNNNNNNNAPRTSVSWLSSSSSTSSASSSSAAVS